MEIKEITAHNFRDIPEICQSCLYWEYPEDFKAKSPIELATVKKQAWFQKVFKEFGNCGKLIYLKDKVAGYTQFASPTYFPQIKTYPISPSNDAIFISCLYILEEFRNQGLGTSLLKAIINECKTGGFKAIETFARRGSNNNPSGPLEFYLRNGFYVSEADKEFPLVRLDL